MVIDYGSLQEIIHEYCTKETVSDQYQNCWHEYYCQDLEVSRFILVNKASLNKDSGLQLLALVLYTI